MDCWSPGRFPRTSIDMAASPDSKNGSQPEEPFLACCWASGTASPLSIGAIMSVPRFQRRGRIQRSLGLGEGVHPIGLQDRVVLGLPVWALTYAVLRLRRP